MRLERRKLTLANPKVALCLGGGGARGVIQLGAVQAWLDAGNEYDAIYGSSVGLINACSLHQHGTLDAAKTLWQTISNKKVFRWNPLLAFGFKACLASTEPLAALLEQNINNDLLRANTKPIYGTATNILAMQAWCVKLPLPTQALTEAFVLGSASVPAIFPQIQYPGDDSVTLTDGGQTDDYGIGQAIRDGYEDITLISPSPPVRKRWTKLTDALEFLISIAGPAQLANEEMAAQILVKHAPPDKSICLRIYQPQGGVAAGLGLIDFDGASKNYQKYFDCGYQLMSQPPLVDLTCQPSSGTFSKTSIVHLAGNKALIKTQENQ